MLAFLVDQPQQQSCRCSKQTSEKPEAVVSFGNVCVRTSTTSCSSRCGNSSKQCCTTASRRCPCRRGILVPACALVTCLRSSLNHRNTIQTKSDCHPCWQSSLAICAVIVFGSVRGRPSLSNFALVHRRQPSAPVRHGTRAPRGLCGHSHRRQIVARRAPHRELLLCPQRRHTKLRPILRRWSGPLPGGGSANLHFPAAAVRSADRPPPSGW